MYQERNHSFAKELLKITDICEIILSYLLIQDAVNIQKKANISIGFDAAIQRLIKKNYSNIIDIDLGEVSSLVCYENALFGCGYNNHGCLGHGDCVERFPFTEVGIPFEIKSIKKIFQSDYHSMLLTNDNELYACGLNDDGQLGLGNNLSCYFSFQKVKLPTELKKIKTVICAHHWTCLVSYEGDFYFSGDPPIHRSYLNRYKFTQCNNDKTTKSKAFIGRGDQMLLLTSDDKIVISKNTDIRDAYELFVIKLPLLINHNNIEIKSMCTSRNLIAFITRNDENPGVYCYEKCSNYQMRPIFKKINLPKAMKVESIACTEHCLFLLTQGNEVYCYTNGELSKVSTARVLSPIKLIKCGAYHVILTTVDNYVYAYSLSDNPFNGYGSGFDEKDWKKTCKGFTLIKSLPVAYFKEEKSAQIEKEPIKKRNNMYFYAGGAFVITLGLILFKKWYNNKQRSYVGSFTEKSAEMAHMSMLH